MHNTYNSLPKLYIILSDCWLDCRNTYHENGDVWLDVICVVLLLLYVSSPEKSTHFIYYFRFSLSRNDCSYNFSLCYMIFRVVVYNSLHLIINV